MTDNKPSNLRQILDRLYQHGLAHADLNISFDTSANFRLDEAVAAITGLLPEKWELYGEPTSISYHEALSRNNTIDTTLRNFSGQTEGDHGDSDSPVESA